MSHARTSRLQEIDIGLRSQEAVWGMERGMERNGHQSENLLESELERQAPRHDPLLVPHDHGPTKRHRLNRVPTFQQPR